MTSKRLSTVRKSLCTRKKHHKVLVNGIPPDAISAITNFHETLPRFYFGGMRNILNEPLALFFNLEDDELHLKFNGTNTIIEIRTIEKVFFEPIFGHEQYYMMCLQLNKTRHSRFWIYWVPCQYKKAIEELINDDFF